MKLLLCIASSMTALLLAEAAVRLLIPKPYWSFHDSMGDWEADRESGWVQKSRFSILTYRDDGIALQFETNEDGLRPKNARREINGNVLRIVLFGDSTAVGRSVPYSDTISARLEDWFRSRGYAVEVFNAGVEGYSTDQSLLRMKHIIPLYRPAIALYCSCSNDLGAILRSREYGLNKPRFVLAENGNLNLVEFAPNERIGGFGRGPRKWLQNSATYRLIQPFLVRLRSRIHGENLDADLGLAPWYYVRSKPDLDAVDWRLFAALLREMGHCCESQGCRFGFFGHPALEEVWDPYIESLAKETGINLAEYDRYALEKRYVRIAEEHGLTFYPLIEAFRRRSAEGPFHLLPRDPHCNEKGYQVAAETLGPMLIADRSVGPLLEKVRKSTEPPRHGN